MKTGTRVKAKNTMRSCHNHSTEDGDLGTIVYYGFDTVTVEFDKHICGHDGQHYTGGQKGKQGHCWNYTVSAMRSGFIIIKEGKSPQGKVTIQDSIPEIRY